MISDVVTQQAVQSRLSALPGLDHSGNYEQRSDDVLNPDRYPESIYRHAPRVYSSHLRYSPAHQGAGISRESVDKRSHRRQIARIHSITSTEPGSELLRHRINQPVPRCGTHPARHRIRPATSGTSQSSADHPHRSRSLPAE